MISSSMSVQSGELFDFAGSSVVHLTGGSTALIATYVLGPRRGRFYDHRGEPLQTPKEFPGHSAALQMVGGKNYMVEYVS